VYLFDVIKRHFTAWRLGRFGHRSHDHPVDRYLEQTENTVLFSKYIRVLEIDPPADAHTGPRVTG